MPTSYHSCPSMPIIVCLNARVCTGLHIQLRSYPWKHAQSGWDARQTAGTVMALSSALTGSFSLLSVRYIKEKEPVLVITIWYHLFCFSLSAVLLAIGVPSKPTMPQGISWILLIVVGVLLFSASLLIDRSLQLGAAARTSVISLSQLVFTWIFGLAFLHEHTNFIAGSGIALLLVGVGLVAFRNVDINEELNTPALKRHLFSRLPDAATD
ncbi:hypothetical protein DUNSADRAFT_17234 [Dunaliella salina]|uniref:EamA domain-containing protein n=1 Tax=Dunaliella salina TaxID=3046 RepID=A0ABQ7G246_DUNSA|nr:hypothetical protein DUNSADRAFT_17234 [Dunaliella salina]|eukprot:KAF5828674.1 hypothetical protein DUNSADRAFT_17234 [Dunaliella salina]